jgi:hypothetical protein
VNVVSQTKVIAIPAAVQDSRLKVKGNMPYKIERNH